MSVGNASSSGASKPPASRCSKRWNSSAGTGPKRSTAWRCRTSSAWSSSKRNPTSCSWEIVGLGKTHLATALGYAACQQGASVLFANAISVINDLSAAQKRGLLKRQLKTYLRPELLALDEIGYLPIDQHGADLLFQVISQRYEQGSIVLTTNKPFKQWPSIFNNDSTIASAVLDRLLHHAQTIVIEGSSYRMKDRENQ